MKRLLLFLLKGYKKYISRGNYCRWVPSCSEYAYEAVEKYGVVKGGWMAVMRLGRCHPLSKGGVDLVK